MIRKLRRVINDTEWKKKEVRFTRYWAGQKVRVIFFRQCLPTPVWKIGKRYRVENLDHCMKTSFVTFWECVVGMVIIVAWKQTMIDNINSSRWTDRMIGYALYDICTHFRSRFMQRARCHCTLKRTIYHWTRIVPSIRNAFHHLLVKRCANFLADPMHTYIHTRAEIVLFSCYRVVYTYSLRAIFYKRRSWFLFFFPSCACHVPSMRQDKKRYSV